MNTIKNLDIFRGIAAILVLLFHFYTFYSSDLLNISDYFKIFSIGHIGVDLFFVLSGFLITLSLWRNDNFIKFFSKRLKRIAPLAIVTTLIFWGISHEKDVIDLFSHLFFVNGFFPEFYSTINPVTWSISIEMAFYLLLPLVWIVLAKKNMQKFFTIFSVLVFLSFAYRVFLFYVFQNNPEISAHEKIIFSEQLWGRLDQFFIGIILAYIYTKNSFKNIISHKNLLIFFTIISSFILFISGYLFFEYQSDFRNILWLQVFLHTFTALGFAGLIFSFVQTNDASFIKNNIITKNLAWFGKISYGIYIFHFAVISVVFKVFQKYSDLFFEYITLDINILFQFLIIFFTTICLSALSYYYFEKKFL